MSRSVPPWTSSTDDQSIPIRVRLRIFDRFDGRCAKCTRRLIGGEWDLDHIVALANGGSHSEQNLQPLCKIPCHSQKTKQDVAEKARTYRKRKRNIGVKRPRTITRWRRFNGEPVYARRER